MLTQVVMMRSRGHFLVRNLEIPSFGRLSDANKKLLTSSHELGPDCNCSMFSCFKVTNLEERSKIVKEF